MSAIRTILVATDFSESSQEAFDVALGIARDTGADVHALYVVPDPLNLPWVVEGAGMDFIELQRTWMADARRELTQMLTARAVDPAKVKATVALGTPAVEIIRHAAHWKADLIVVGSHGRGTMGRLLIGSVAQKVLHEAGCPVMVVPHRRAKTVTTARETGRSEPAVVLN
jgi:nucleotide-binding universal stress UspA family protein